MSITRTAPLALLTASVVASLAPAAGPLGYYRQPALSMDVIVFVAEGDLWKVGIKGGTAQNLWKFAGDAEAVPLTADYKGTSKRPMWWKGRVYFLSDRDGTMNLWSMKPDGTDPKQHTQHDGWDAASASLADGRVAYQ